MNIYLISNLTNFQTSLIPINQFFLPSNKILKHSLRTETEKERRVRKRKFSQRIPEQSPHPPPKKNLNPKPYLLCLLLLSYVPRHDPCPGYMYTAQKKVPARVDDNSLHKTARASSPRCCKPNLLMPQVRARERRRRRKKEKVSRKYDLFGRHNVSTHETIHASRIERGEGKG